MKQDEDTVVTAFLTVSQGRKLERTGRIAAMLRTKTPTVCKKVEGIDFSKANSSIFFLMEKPPAFSGPVLTDTLVFVLSSRLG